MAYEFVGNMLRDAAGTQGMKFFPLVFSLFMFVLVANLLGLFPYFFTVTSHIIVTFGLAALVIGTVIVYGFMKHGLGFLKLFVPQGVPMYLLPLVVAIEVISFVSRPVSLSVRLFANMLAGHITLKVFSGFVVSLSALGALGVARLDPAAGHGRRADGAGTAGRLPAGLRLCGADLHVSERRTASGSLIDFTGAAGVSLPTYQPQRLRKTTGVQHGRRSSKVPSVPVSLALAWVARASASATSSAATCPARCATRRPLTASSAV